MMRLVPRLPLAATALLLGAAPARAQVQWEQRAPIRAERTGAFADEALTESSGLAASRRSAGLLWTIEDSRNDPLIHATDSLGRDLGSWTVAGAENVDWEALAVGPCPAGHCLYIGDTGDNAERRAQVVIYRVAEPDISERPRTTAPAQSLSFRYPDGPRDTEAMLVTPVGDVLLISKGRRGPSRLYRLRASAWDAPSAVADSLGPLALPGDAGITGQVTDAALSPDGRSVVVRTYVDLFFFELRADSRLMPASPPVTCSVFGLEMQGEGVDWLDGRRLALAGERALGVPGGIAIVECPLGSSGSLPK